VAYFSSLAQPIIIIIVLHSFVCYSRNCSSRKPELDHGSKNQEKLIEYFAIYYVASSRGSVIQVHKASCVDPVILLNESDKIGQRNIHGDPSTALLEVLDLEQNWNFDHDHINVPTYLYQDLFIYAASFLDTISSPLLDRCEIVHLAGFSFDEKVVIANRVLVPNQIGMDGLKKTSHGDE